MAFVFVARCSTTAVDRSRNDDKSSTASIGQKSLSRPGVDGGPHSPVVLLRRCLPKRIHRPERVTDLLVGEKVELWEPTSQNAAILFGIIRPADGVEIRVQLDSQLGSQKLEAGDEVGISIHYSDTNNTENISLDLANQKVAHIQLADIYNRAYKEAGNVGSIHRAPYIAEVREFGLTKPGSQS